MWNLRDKSPKTIISNDHDNDYDCVKNVNITHYPFLLVKNYKVDNILLFHSISLFYIRMHFCPNVGLDRCIL